ncbi:hypothetical protein BDZ97DRAFT_1928626 [Flammula alnicola]|nr:hypothetical protein BDZ97DRAFT_1928626 [Flammula alnicola]
MPGPLAPPPTAFVPALPPVPRLTTAQQLRPANINLSLTATAQKHAGNANLSHRHWLTPGACLSRVPRAEVEGARGEEEDHRVSGNPPPTLLLTPNIHFSCKNHPSGYRNSVTTPPTPPKQCSSDAIGPGDEGEPPGTWEPTLYDVANPQPPFSAAGRA